MSAEWNDFLTKFSLAVGNPVADASSTSGLVPPEPESPGSSGPSSKKPKLDFPRFSVGVSCRDLSGLYVTVFRCSEIRLPKGQLGVNQEVYSITINYECVHG